MRFFVITFFDKSGLNKLYQKLKILINVIVDFKALFEKRKCGINSKIIRCNVLEYKLRLENLNNIK